ncbi:MAG: uroporphyrinogen decarboxylase family protein [bacterium]
MRQPDFNNLLAVLRRDKPSRPTLFEFFLNGPLYARLAGMTGNDNFDWNSLEGRKTVMKANLKAGYDYTVMQGAQFGFPAKQVLHQKSRSMNDTAIIVDRESFELYEWPDPEKCDYGMVDKMAKELPDGMKIIIWGPGGVLENVMQLCGYENLCFMIADDPDLVHEIFENVGSRFIKYYELSVNHDGVGAVISNDDWGFNTQTMLAPAEMREYVMPWHRKIVETIHAAGKPAILHSCGNLKLVMDDIIDDLGYQGKHSYEDNILPVEDAYELWGSRIAILGGIDLDFVCRSTPEEVYKRSKAMIERSAERGGYALGTGNSVPYYVPDENYFAMIKAANEEFSI